MPLDKVLQIVADDRVRGTTIWQLAYAELDRRMGVAA
jgi:hypothetical protein